MRHFLAYFLFAAAFIFTRMSSADVVEHPWAFGGGVGQSFPFVSGTFYDDEVHKIHGSVWGRYYFGSQYGLELNYNRLSFSHDYSEMPGANINGYTLNGFYQVYFNEKWSEIMAVGVGLGDIHDFPNAGYSELYILARYGIEYNLRHDLSIGAHAQLNYLSATNEKAPGEIYSIGYLLSITYHFGAGNKPRADETATPAESAH